MRAKISKKKKTEYFTRDGWKQEICLSKDSLPYTYHFSFKIETTVLSFKDFRPLFLKYFAIGTKICKSEILIQRQMTL